MICGDCFDDPCTCLTINYTPGKTEVLHRQATVDALKEKLRIATEALERIGEQGCSNKNCEAILVSSSVARAALERIAPTESNEGEKLK